MRLADIEKDHSLCEAVYQTVYKQIMTGKLSPGQKIAECNISAALGISRSPVREALKRLAEDCLVTFVPRKGCCVTESTRAELEEIYEIRKRLECLALEQAFARLDRNELAALRQKFAECRNLAEPKLLKGELKLDAQLHHLIAQASGWHNLCEMLGKIRARIQVYRVRQALCLEWANRALNEHIQLLDILLAGDKAQAIHCLEAHIESTKQSILQDHKG